MVLCYEIYVDETVVFMKTCMNIFKTQINICAEFKNGEKWHKENTLEFRLDGTKMNGENNI